MIWNLGMAQSVARALGIFVALCALVCVAGLPCRAETGASEPPCIVVFHSYHEGFPWSSLFHKGMLDRANEGSGPIPTVYVEWLDHHRFPSAWRSDAYRAYIADKYRDKRVDFVMADDFYSASFLADAGRDVFAGSTMIYASSRELPNPHPAGYKSSTWMPLTHDYRKGIDIALSLHPQASRIEFITDRRESDQERLGKIRQIMASHGGRYQVAYYTDFDMRSLLKHVGDLSEDTVVFYTLIFEDNEGRLFVPAEVVRKLAEVSPAPIYSFWDTFLGTGIVGGYLVSAEKSGLAAMDLALASWAGESLDHAMGRANGESACMFDWRQMKRFGISEADLPKGATVRYREASQWEQHRALVIFTLSVVLVEALLIARLLFLSSWRKSALAAKAIVERDLRDAKATLEERVAERTRSLSEANARLVGESEARRLTAEELRKNVAELQEAMEEIKSLQGILPICSYCHRVRDDEGYWQQVEAYMSRHSGMQFSHGVCPECLERARKDAGF